MTLRLAFDKADISFRAATVQDSAWAYGLFRRAIEPVIVRQLGAWPEDRQRHFFFEVGKFPTAQSEVILHRGQPVGTCEIKDSGDFIHISGIYLEEDMRGKGIGDLVIRRALDQARAARKPLQLETLIANGAAQAAFKAMGFEEIGQNKYERIFRHKDTHRYDASSVHITTVRSPHKDNGTL